MAGVSPEHHNPGVKRLAAAPTQARSTSECFMPWCEHCLTDHSGLCLDERRRREFARALTGRSDACPYCGVDGPLCPVVPRSGAQMKEARCLNRASSLFPFRLPHHTS